MTDIQYKHFGVMLDCSRNGVMKVSEIKHMIDCLAKMGYDTLQLYTEDTYIIKDEPYFGYMRGGYSSKEIKEIDFYARAKGIELVPCIQTLAHFTNLVKLEHFKDIVDVNDILLIDDEKTYVLIEKMFKTLAENFSSRLVNIGMDEAHLVGLGKFLDKHGYENRFDILLRHLHRVNDIAIKYGFKPHMWSDMFFRLVNNGKYYGKELTIPQRIVSAMPDNMELVFWNYYDSDKTVYDEMLTSHKKTGKTVWFAGGAWSWAGFAPLNGYTLKTMKPAMQSVREQNIENVLITMWGDDGKECSFFSLLPSLYAIRCYANGIEDENVIKRDFFKIFNIAFDDFMLLDTPNIMPKSSEWDYVHVPSKVLLYCDCFMNSYDYYGVDFIDDIYYNNCANKLTEAKTRVGEYEYLFESLAALCRVLAIKSTLSIRTRVAYQKKDNKALKELLSDYERAESLLKEFHTTLRTEWEKENKPFGWEIHDIRLGGVIRRIKTCKERLQQYLEGRLSCIEEIEVAPLPMYELPFSEFNYKRIISSSEI